MNLTPKDLDACSLELSFELFRKSCLIGISGLYDDYVDVIGSNAHGPYDAVIVVVLFYDGSHRTGYADAVATHDHRVIHLVFVSVKTVHWL